ncbi:MAG: O-antigen ligase family protein [Clostridiales bacterium]|nr:O-antigen ligase family protein [Clostridiales bacterium]
MANDLLRVKDTTKELNLLRMIFVLSLFVAGGSLPLISAVLTLMLLALILYMYVTRDVTIEYEDEKYKKKRIKIVKAIRLPADPVMVFLAVLLACLFLTLIWPADKGIAPFGIVKFLPLPLFAIALYMTEDKGRETLLGDIPYTGALMTVLAGLLALIPSLKGTFVMSGRLAGFLGDPEAFALLCLAGFTVLFLNSKTETGVISFITGALLLAGIILSGSVFVIILWVISIPVIIIVKKDKKVTISLLSLAAIAAVLFGSLFALKDRLDVVGRYTARLLDTTPFLSRILYCKDALPQILSHPVGLGYRGYEATLGAFQTGAYDVSYVHNEYLQLALDAGWAPLAVALVCLFFALKKIVKKPEKFIPAVIVAVHLLFNFDLQFIGMGFLLIILLASERYREIKVVTRSLAVLLFVLCGGIALYFGTADAFCLAKNYDAALTVYPVHTDALIAKLDAAEKMNEAEGYADRILSLSSINPKAASLKGRAQYNKGDFEGLVDYKIKALANDRYNLAEYKELIDYLNKSIAIYAGKGDEVSAKIAMDFIVAIGRTIDQVNDSTSDLGLKLNKESRLELPGEYDLLIETYRTQLGRTK